MSMDKPKKDEIGIHRPFMDVFSNSLTEEKRLQEIENLLEFTPVSASNLDSYGKKIPREFKRLKSFTKEVIELLEAVYYPCKLNVNYSNNHNDKYAFKLKFQSHPVISEIRGRIKSEQRFLEKFYNKLESNVVIKSDFPQIKDCSGIEFIIYDSIISDKHFTNMNHDPLSHCYYIAEQIEILFSPLLIKGDKPFRKDYFASPEERIYKCNVGNYEALHTYVFDKDSIREIQIKFDSIDKRAHNPSDPLYHGLCKTSSRYLVDN